jgi:hypothetical protein
VPASRKVIRRITTFVAGLRLTGMSAPMVFDGPPAAGLGAGTRAQRRRHHRQPVRPQWCQVRDQSRQAQPQLLYLPPYSPNFKNAFTKLKEGLWHLVGKLLECAHYFAAAGHDSD